MELDKLVETEFETEINIRVDGRTYRITQLRTLNTILMSISRRLNIHHSALEQAVINAYNDDFVDVCKTVKYLEERCA